MIEKLATLVALARQDFHSLERSIGIEGNGGVVEEVSIDLLEHAAAAQDEVDVTAQLLTDDEGVVELRYEHLFLGRELVGMSRVDGGEVAGEHLVGLSIYTAGAGLEVDRLQELAAAHLPQRVLINKGGFELKLDNTDGFVHAGNEEAALVVDGHILGDFGQELLTRIVAIDVHGKGGKVDEVDAVAVLQGQHVVVAQGDANDVAYTNIVACARAHPQHVVVAPGDVPVVVTGQDVEDGVGTGTSVINVTKDVELVDDEALDDVADGDDKLVGAANLDDRGDDRSHIVDFVLRVGMLMEQLLDDVGEVRG